MLNCKEQKNPVEFYGRKITLSEQALNAIYEYCSTPVTSSTIGMYVFAKFVGTPTAKLSEQEIVDSLTDEQITKITEDGIKEEILESSAGEEFWNKFA